MDELTRKKLLVEEVADAVCTKYGIDIERVFSRDKHKVVTDARNIMAYILHKDLGLSITFVAKELNRSESWVLKTCAKMALHISLYDDCIDEHDFLLTLLNK